MAVQYIIGGLAGVILSIGGFYLWRRSRHVSLVNSLKLKLFLIKIPRSAESESGDFKFEIGKTEQLLASLSGMKEPFVFEMAVPHVGEEISFFLALPRSQAEIATKQIQGLWNSASVVETDDDYNIFNPGGVTAAAYVGLHENSALPIRTYTELNADTFASILGGFSKVADVGEGAALQLVVKPAAQSFKKNYLRYISELKKGRQLKEIIGAESFDFKNIANALSPEENKKEEEHKSVDEGALKLIDFKVSKPLFSVNLRLMASAGTPFQANDILDGLAAGFAQFASPTKNDFKIVKVKNPKDLTYKFCFRLFDDSKSMVLNSEEIASFFHLPSSTSDAPRIKWLKSKESAPPTNLPDSGTLLGWSSFRGESRPVYVTDEDRRRHIYVLGQTGTGKTTMISSMLIDDINAGKGIALIDPHGEFSEKILGRIPKSRMDDLIYLDPADLSRPFGLNMLEYNLDHPEEKTFIINELINIFDKLYDLKTTGGPMFEYYLRNALVLLMEDMPNEPATIMEVSRVFTDAKFRERKLGRIYNASVIDFWEKIATKASGEQSLANFAPYISSKFSSFNDNDYIRPIIGQPKSSFNFREAMDSGKILILNLSKGRIGDLNASLLGMIFIGKLLMASLSRIDTEESKRKDFYLYIDEFQNFATDSVATILSEARKYRLSLTIAHQFIAQLKDPIRDAIFGNVGTQAIMRVGIQDAEFLVKQFAPTFDQNDLVNIDNLNAYVKLLIKGETSKPFNIKVNNSSWSQGDNELADKLKEYSRLKFGTERRRVEEDIFKRLRE